MAKTAVIHTRIEEDIKTKVENILKLLGLTTTEAINMFLYQIIINQGIPFEVKILSNTTIKTINDMKKGKNLKYAANKEDFFKQLED